MSSKSYPQLENSKVKMQKSKLQVKNRDWKKMKLGKAFDLKYGFGLPKRSRKAGNIPVYGSSGVVGMHNEATVNSQGIIIGRKGNVGSVYYSSSPFYPIDTVYYIDSLKIQGNLKFFYYFLRRIPFQKIGSDVGVPGLNRDIAYNLDIIIPKNINEQKQIAAILSAFDNKIELNNKISRILEQITQTIFKEWFIKFRFPGYKKTKLVNSELGKIPKEWKMKRLGKITKIEYGKGPATKDFKKNGYPVYGANGIIGYSEKYKFNDSQTIVGCRGVVGSLFKTLPMSSITHNSLIISPINFSEINYLFMLLKNSNLQSVVGGSAQPQITINEISQLPVLFATQITRREFEKIAESIEQKRLNLIYENQKLASLRDLLLPKLMSGEIRI